MTNCPYCNRSIDLRNCQIVATNFVGDNGPVSASFFDDEPQAGGEVKLASGELARVGAAGYPVMFDPALVSVGRLRRAVSRPPKLLDHCRPENMPARLCTDCATPLPDDIGERPLVTIAIVGPQGSGKSHFIATAFTAVYRDQAFAPLGYSNFYPTGNTEQVFHDAYFTNVFEDFATLPATQVADVRRQPLTFRARRDGREVTVLVHDISGELLTDRVNRHRLAPFVHYADGLVFMIDPWGLSAVRAKIADRYPGLDSAARGFTQTQIINSIADDIEQIDSRRLKTIPVAFAISKSDLVVEALGVDTQRFNGAEVTPQQRLAEIHDISTMIRSDLLSRLGEGSLASAIARYEQASLHLVAALGSQPGAGERITDLRPSRITDPMYSVLDRVLDGRS